MPGVTFVLPSLALTVANPLADRQRDYPLLARCLGSAPLIPREGPLEPTLLTYCDLAPTTALAALCACHDLGPTARELDLLRADPVHLHADPNRVLVYGPAHLDLHADEADALLELLQREFPALGCRRGAAPTRWYLTRPPEVSGSAPSVQWLHGRSLTPFMPGDSAGRAWRRWLNDVQMVLHDAPVNRARAARGLPVVNGLWWFGGGDPVPVTRAPGTRLLIGNDVLLAGIAAATGFAWRSVATPAECLAAVRAGAEVVIVGGGAFGTADTAPELALDQIETRWLPVLLGALRWRRLARLQFETATHRATLGWRHGLAWRRTSTPLVIE